MDAISEERLREVSPALAQKVRQMAAALAVQGIRIRVTQGLRSWKMQQELWQQGRDSHGNIANPHKVVTDAPPGHSWHEFGCACDLVPLDAAGAPIWDRDSEPGKTIWQTIVHSGVANGLFPGAHFSKPDFPHFQLTGDFDESPSAYVRHIFIEAGMQQVWREAGIDA